MYVVTQEWTLLWKNFLYVNNRFLRRNFIKGHTPPGPINNSILLESDGKTPKPNLVKVINKILHNIKNTHYRMVNEYIWKLFLALYGGGPAIKRVGKDIYTGAADQDYPEIKFSEEDKYNIEELKAMIPAQDQDEKKEEEEKTGEKNQDEEFSDPDHDSEEASPKIKHPEKTEDAPPLKLDEQTNPSPQDQAQNNPPPTVEIHKTEAEISFRPYKHEEKPEEKKSEAVSSDNVQLVVTNSENTQSSSPKKEPSSPLKDKPVGSPGHKRSKATTNSPEVKRKGSTPSPNKLTLQDDEKIDLQNTRNSPVLKSLSSKDNGKTNGQEEDEVPKMFNLDQLEEAQNTENTEREQTQENGAQEIKEVTLQIDVREQNTTNDSSKISTETKPETEGDK